jgi:L-ribulose-5-phosphate 3-epimerase
MRTSSAKTSRLALRLVASGLVHLSDTARQIYRHDPVGQGTVPFAEVPPVLAAIGYRARPMLEIISRDPDRDIVASAAKLAAMGFTQTSEVHLRP